MIEGFFGVFAPNGELEAVESTEDAANNSALMLSPFTNGKPPQVANRKVEPVTIIRGDVADYIETLLLKCSSSVAVNAYNAYQKQIALCTGYHPTTGKPILIPTPDYFAAKEKLRAVLAIRDAIK